MDAPLFFDVETHLIKPARTIPPLVCMSVEYDGDVDLYEKRDAIEVFEGMLDSGRQIVGHNVAFDIAVMCRERPEFLPRIFDAYEEGRIGCTMIRQKLIDLAEGRYYGFVRIDGKTTKIGYGLDDLCLRLLGRELPKTEIRLQYEKLDGVPFDEWPELARDYAMTDSAVTSEVWHLQQANKTWRTMYLLDQYRQCCAAWWIQLMQAWGLRTDPEGVRRFAAELQDEFDQKKGLLIEHGLMRPNGTRNTKVAAAYMIKTCMRRGMKPVVTSPSKKFPKGQVSLSAEHCEATGDEVMKAYAEVSSLKKQLSTDIPLLQRGTVVPIHPRWESIKETGRTGTKPNVQNVPVYGKMRECFVPRPGMVFASADYDGFELRTMSQFCVSKFGKSKLAEALNAGLDPHLVVASKILKISYEEAKRRKEADDDEVYRARQTAKVANFGFPGGLGAVSLVAFAKSNYNVDITEDEARKLKEDWLEAWPEFRTFFAYFGQLCEQAEPQFVQLFSNRFRGDVIFTAACNCLDEETEALTKRGWVKGFDLVPGDFLLTKNAETNALEWEPISRMLLKPDYEGRLVEFKTKNFSAVTTPDHRWLVTTKKGEVCCKTTDEIGSNGDYRIHRSGDYQAPTSSPYTDDFVELVGWILTDGSLPKNKNSVCLYQSERGNLEKVEKIDALFRRLKIEPTRRVDERHEVVCWSIGAKCNYSQALREFFPDRLMTMSFLLQLTKKQLRILLDTMVLGDGTRNGNKRSFSARSKEVACMFQVLCTMNGLSSKVRWAEGTTAKPSPKMDNCPRGNGVWIVSVLERDTVQVVNLKKKYGISKTRTQQRIDFEGKRPVWCPVVKNTYFVVRRDGGVFVTGNSAFQGLAADAAKAAGFLIARACYVEPESPLYGSRIVNFIHDEFILESPEEKATEAAEELAKLMVKGASVFLPDVPPKASPLLMRRWSKKAKEIRDDNGRLVPWE